MTRVLPEKRSLARPRSGVWASGVRPRTFRRDVFGGKDHLVLNIVTPPSPLLEVIEKLALAGR
jgi:hypothetical protein